MATAELNINDMAGMIGEFHKLEEYTSHEYRKITLPLLRATFPKLMASNIVNVQPMTGIDFNEYANVIAKWMNKTDPIEESLKEILADLENFE